MTVAEKINTIIENLEFLIDDLDVLQSNIPAEHDLTFSKKKLTDIANTFRIRKTLLSDKELSKQM